MSDTSSMLLIGIGGAGGAMARGVARSFGDNVRMIVIDTDASSGQSDAPFALIGADRLSGRGSGGDLVSARMVTEDSFSIIDGHLEGARLAVIVTALGGGTGSGATLETAKHLNERGIPSIVFATTPFSFEGEERHRIARGIMPMIEEAANATFFLPLDKLVMGEDIMESALRRAIDTLASAVTLFWRLVEKPGYLRIDSDRIRHLLGRAGRGRFAAATAQGPNRSSEIVEALTKTELLTDGSGPVRSILCGVLGGEDLRLSEISTIASGVRTSFGEHAAFELATVNDEMAFCGRLSVIVMLFEGDTSDEKTTGSKNVRHGRKQRNALSGGPQGRGRFNNTESTTWNGEDLDIPTFLRKNINLEF